MPLGAPSLSPQSSFASSVGCSRLNVDDQRRKRELVAWLAGVVRA